MKKTCLLLLLPIFIVSCKQYRLEFVINDEEQHTNLDEYSASSDEKAYQKAVDYIDRYFSAVDNERIYSHIHFDVYKGNRLLDNRKDIVPQIITKQQSLFKDEEKKAFADAKFGMSKEEVLKLPKFRSYLKLSDQLLSEVNIGGVEFLNFLKFGANNELYEVVFESFYTDYHGALKDAMDTFKEVIENVYGPPHKKAAYNTQSTLKVGYVHWAYVWKIGKKGIFIGAGLDTNYRYYVKATIVDTVRQKEYEKDTNKKKQQSINEYIQMF